MKYTFWILLFLCNNHLSAKVSINQLRDGLSKKSGEVVANYMVKGDGTEYLEWMGNIFIKEEK